MALTRLRAITAHFLRQPHPIPSRAASTIVHNDNIACCTVPPVSSSYEPKGSFIPYAGFNRVYAVGPINAPVAIICIYDIFGFKPQTQQGADMLSVALDARVVMPDFFEPSAPWDTSRHPPKTKEDQEAFQAFFVGPANPGAAVEKLERVARALRVDGAKHVGAYGLCWGGKVAALAGGKETPLSAIGTAHPAMLKADDTTSLSIPLAIYVSKDEPQDEYTKILDILKTKSFADKTDSKFHGWAGARANLNDPENRRLQASAATSSSLSLTSPSRFNDVYRRFAEFFKRNLV
ncbi:hypothetical protein K488DRAFT_43713 [Vararia minispora EC-137]|uniref:Uncharacterized protein n=1 Tax=Vararia minispora EC-137 TaxID=1314806 RepID=A0ACB8QUE8_9AGAM|nr:hypothetical protein K488DRAFT_43713 [Vararia minispora EC-137]